MSETASARNVEASGTRNGVEWEIVRAEVPGSDEEAPMLYIEGERKMSAGALAAAGWDEPRVTALKHYAKAFIDGMAE